MIEAPNPEAFLSEKQYSLLKSGRVLAVPTMMGFAAEEKIKFYQSNRFYHVLWTNRFVYSLQIRLYLKELQHLSTNLFTR